MNKPLLLTSAWPCTLCLLLLFTFTSCEKEGPDPDPKKEEPITCRLTKEYPVNDTTSYTLNQYNDQNKLAEFTSYYKNKPRTHYIYSYNALGQVNKLTIKDKYLDANYEFTIDVVDVYSFEYNAKGQISKYLYERPIPGNEARPKMEGTYEYDAAGNRTKIISSFPDNVDYNDQVSVFTYLNGNCIQEIRNPGKTWESKLIFEYYLDQEDKQRAFYDSYRLLTMIGPTASKNMLKKTTYDDTQKTEIADYSYKYNEQGYIVEYVRDFKSRSYSGIINNKLEYDCQ